MNFVGHIAVGGALRQGTAVEPAFLLGTALPDLATMARVRLDRAAMARLRLDPIEDALGEGIALHHQTDAVFHRQRWFLEAEHALLDELAAAGLPRGGALACAHVGVELLLDGALVRDDATAEAVGHVYGLMASPPADAVALAPRAARAYWRRTLAGIAARLDPEGYGDAATVAQRLHGVVSRRPRLAFSADLVPVLADRLASHQPRIAAQAPAVLARVIHALHAAMGNTRALG